MLPADGRTGALFWSGPSMDQVAQAASDFAASIQPRTSMAFSLLGPGPSGIKVIKDQVRWHALIKGSSRGAIQQLLNTILPLTHPLGRKGTRCIIDIDPQSIT